MEIYEIFHIEKIVFLLKKNYACIIETDTQLGLISHDANLLYELKKRPQIKKIVTFVPNKNAVKTDHQLFLELTKKFWPGALTLILDGISYRMPDHEQLLKILHKTGPIFSTSANLHGEEPFNKVIDYQTVSHFQNYGNRLFLVNGCAKTRLPSTVFNVNNGIISRKGLLYHELIAFLKLMKIKYVYQEK